MIKYVLLSSALSLIGVTSVHSTEPLTVAYYGGNWGDAFDKCVVKPFTQETGIPVVAEIGNSTTTFSKLQQQIDNPIIDVAYMDGGISEAAHEAGLLTPISINNLANGATLHPEAIYKDGETIFAVGAGFYSLGLTYNTDEVKETPTSWKSLWDDAYAGAVAIPSPSNSAGVPFVIFLNNVLNEENEDISEIISELSTLDTGLLYDTSGSASNAFQSGDIAIGAHFNVGAWDLIDAGMPIGFVVPSEGVWATDVRMHIVKDSKNAEAAQKYIDYAISKEAANCLAENLYLGPSVTGVTLTEDVEKKLPWGVSGSIDNLKLLNWSDVNSLRADITDRWNREIAK